MNTQQATALVERYFAGQTTLAEERTLAAYFAGGEVAEELRQYTPLFAYWQQQRTIIAPAKAPTRRRLPRALLAVAAALLLLLVANVVHRQQQPALTNFPVAERQPVDWSRYEVTDKDEALRILKTALQLTGDQARHAPATALQQLRTVDNLLH